MSVSLAIINSVIFIVDIVKDLHKQLYDGNLEPKEIEKAKEGQVNRRDSE